MSFTNVPLRLSRSALMYLSPSFSMRAWRRETAAFRIRRFAPVWRPISTGPSLIAMTVSFNLPVIAASRGFIRCSDRDAATVYLCDRDEAIDFASTTERRLRFANELFEYASIRTVNCRYPIG